MSKVTYVDSIIYDGINNLCSHGNISLEAYNAIHDILQEAFVEIAEITPIENTNKDESSSVDYSIKADAGKYRPTLCHQSMIEAVATVREHGAKKYGDSECWKRVEEQRYKDALYRHWLAYLENPDGIDEDSGLPILWHAACNMDFLVEMQKERIKNGKINNPG